MPDPSFPQPPSHQPAPVDEPQSRDSAWRRHRRIGIIVAVTGGAAVLALVVGFLVVGGTPRPTPGDTEIAGLQEYPGLPAKHVGPEPVDYEATYGMKPPAGGDHFQAWLNCGIYDQPQPNENAVHALEHGAVWVTYDPDALGKKEIQALRDAVPTTYAILSPFPGLPAPVVISAWGTQVQLDGVDDPRLASFIQKYWKSPTAPEPGAPCTGALDGPGRVA